MFIYYKRTVLYSLISLIGIYVIVTCDFQKVFHWYFSELTTIATRLQVKRDVSSMEFPHVINSPTVRPNCIVIIISHIALAINRKLVIRIQSTTHEECRWTDDLPSLGRERSGGKKPLKSVTHGQCEATPSVTFPTAGHHPTGRYQIIRFGDRGTFCANNWPKDVTWKRSGRVSVEITLAARIPLKPLTTDVAHCYICRTPRGLCQTLSSHIPLSLAKTEMMFGQRTIYLSDGVQIPPPR